MTDRTMMLAKPITYFEDQGVLGLVDHKLGLGLFKQQEFIMNVHWKDSKHYGEGVAYCVGKFTDMNNYFFTNISISLMNPRKEFIVVLDDNTIDVS